MADFDSSNSASRTLRCTLPPEKVFSVQVGTEVFRLSGASIASDAPSYFSEFFEEQLRLSDTSGSVRTLYIDRDPATFREIARHLQGYHVQPQNGAQFVKLFADSQFYSLPRLISQLFESEIFIQIGDRHFQIARDVFSTPGDSPNFFTLGFGAFFASPTAVFPGLERRGLLRPPAIVPPSVPNRSADVFSELLHLSRGYPLHIRNEDHRAELLRDCRYFHLRGLEQKLIPHHISTNPFTERSEITIRLEDVRPSGLHVSRDIAGYSVAYSRPFVDESPSDLLLETAADSVLVDRATQRAEFIGQMKPRIASLVQVLAKKINLSESQFCKPPLQVRCLEGEADLTIDGKRDSQWFSLTGSPTQEAPPAKRQRYEGPSTIGLEGAPLVIRRGQWRLQVQSNAIDTYELILIAVKLEICTGPLARNRTRDFL